MPEHNHKRKTFMFCNGCSSLEQRTLWLKHKAKKPKPCRGCSERSSKG